MVEEVVAAATVEEEVEADLAAIVEEAVVSVEVIVMVAEVGTGMEDVEAVE